MQSAKAQPECLHRLDRLHLVVALLLVATGCKGEGETAGSEPSAGNRVNAVPAEKEEVPEPDAFCDRYHEPSEAPQFEFPDLRGEPPEPPEGWRWINVWATWCDPCIEEMPRLVEWREKLSDHGLAALTLISIDDAPEKVETFRADHPDTPESLQIVDPQKAEPWLESLGLAGGGSLPVHVFVDSDNRVRCLRAGGVGEDAYPAVERLLDT